MPLKSKLDISKKELQELFDTCSSRQEIVESVGLKANSSSLLNLKRRAQKLKINMTKFEINFELKFYKQVVAPNSTFGKLTVIEKMGKTKERTNLWKCQCSCGNNIITRSTYLRKGHTKSCGCYHIELITKFTEEEADMRFFYYTYKNRAKLSNKKFDISFEDFSKITVLPCYYCDSLPQKRKNINRKNRKFVASGLDRIDNATGYYTYNVVPCCSVCNSFKSNLSQADFIEHVIKIAAKISTVFNLHCNDRHYFSINSFSDRLYIA